MPASSRAIGIQSVMHEVVETSTYLKAAGALFTPEEMTNIVTAVAMNPKAGDVMPGTGGCRKMRFGRSGMGKRGGVRIVYYYGGDALPVFLITVYAKSEKGNLSKGEQNALSQLTKYLSEDYGNAHE